MKRRKMRGRPTYGCAVNLSALPVDSANDGVWNVLAYEADLAASGVKLTKKDFEDCVANFAKYPKVPLVIEHADTDLFGKAEWAEPCGWVVALRVGTFTRPGGAVVASLEGRIQANEETRLSINGDEKNPPKWPFGSVTVFRGHDEENDVDVGMCLWSFSLTAHPRLVDVPRLAAGQRGPADAARAGYFWGSIDDREDLVEALRQIFELPALAPEADVLAQLDRFEKLVTGTEAADGIDTDCLLRNIREAMRLPALSTAAEVIAEVRRGLTTLPEEPAQMSRGAAAKESAMKTFLQLAAMIGLAAATEDEASAKVTAAAKEGLELRTALGAKDHTDASAKLSALTTAAAKVPALEGEIATFRKERDDRETAERAGYVNDVLLGMTISDEQRELMKPSLELHAKTDFAGFKARYKRPSAETLSQRAQDSERTARTGAAGRTKAAPADVGAKGDPSGEDIAMAAQVLVEEHADRGVHLSMSEAIGMITSGIGGAEDPEPADPNDDGDEK
jgi:hypothetical protein